MEIVFEILGEFIFEVLFYTGTDRKISKWVRYPILFIVLVFFLTVILGIFALAVSTIEKNAIISIVLIIIDALISIGIIKKVLKEKIIRINK